VNECRLRFRRWPLIEADREALLTVLEERYGYSRADAEREVDDFIAARQARIEAAVNQSP